MTNQIDWYERRMELNTGDAFLTQDGDKVMLDRRVPGDGTKWYVLSWNTYTNGWAAEDSTIEPGELRGRFICKCGGFRPDLIESNGSKIILCGNCGGEAEEPPKVILPMMLAESLLNVIDDLRFPIITSQLERAISEAKGKNE